MLFNSFEFFVFFSGVFLFCLFLPHRWQNRGLLAASYLFYGAWDVRFLLLIILCTFSNYFAAAAMEKVPSRRWQGVCLAAAVGLNLGVLAFFKYYNFFVANTSPLLSSFGLDPASLHLNIILPVGISFFTFQAMSYVVDVYRRRVQRCRSLLDFSLFVAFFPQLIAGPIERASHLLPQITSPRHPTWQGISNGVVLFLYGLFQKVVVADNLALLADGVFGSPEGAGAGTILLGVYAFSFQIFCDFAGYSNMARGIAAALGFELMINFNAPYFAVNPSDFWQRWHISLSRWLRDYLYIPLGGNRLGRGRTLLNLMAAMLLGGLWHGAAWTFVLWGAFHGALLVVYRFLQESGDRLSHRLRGFLQRPWWVLRWLLFFHLLCLGWLLFRAESAGQAFSLLERLVSLSPGSSDDNPLLMAKRMLPWCGAAMVLQYVEFRSGDFLSVTRWPLLFRTALYLLLFYGIVIFGVHDAQTFIYFQF